MAVSEELSEPFLVDPARESNERPPGFLVQSPGNSLEPRHQTLNGALSRYDPLSIEQSRVKLHGPGFFDHVRNEPLVAIEPGSHPDPGPTCGRRGRIRGRMEDRCIDAVRHDDHALSGKRPGDKHEVADRLTHDNDCIHFFAIGGKGIESGPVQRQDEWDPQIARDGQPNLARTAGMGMDKIDIARERFHERLGIGHITREDGRALGGEPVGHGSRFAHDGASVPISHDRPCLSYHVFVQPPVRSVPEGKDSDMHAAKRIGLMTLNVTARRSQPLVSFAAQRRETLT